MLPVIIALDFEDNRKALGLLLKCDPAICRVKIGKGMFTRYGLAFVKEVITLGFDVFLDLKFHDIPNTVYDACRAACDLGVWMINVHALGGQSMMIKAREATDNYSTNLIAVTLLTSMDQSQLNNLGCSMSIADMVHKLASSAHVAGLDGIVASSHETMRVKQDFGSEFIAVTPGIRLKSDDRHDQKRVMTPSQALEHGADFLVIGRSITQALDPTAKLQEIQLDIQTKGME